MKIKYALFLLLILPFACKQETEEDFLTQYEELFEAKDSANTEKLLRRWEKKKPNDPELYVSGFNFYMLQARENVMVMSSLPREDEGLSIKDSSGNNIGYIDSRIFYEKELFDKGITFLEKGIAKHPKRLDMLLGRIYVLGDNNNFEAQTDGIIKMLDKGKAIDHQWLWKMGDTLDDGSDAEINATQDYIYGMVQDQDPPLCDQVSQIAEKFREIYPDHIFGYSNIGICKLVNQEYDEAISWFEKVLEMEPTDEVTLSNMAYAYKSQNKNAKALEYYGRLAKFGEGEYKAFAMEQLAELGKK
ncbi:MAG: hypothetical protein MRZ79_19660 [Bacteroidia bacterium]|nr:hypothetical protein [Bacteroidia bacterium]